MYKVNPAAFSTVFVLPGDIADKHLKLCSAGQLKVILWLYRRQAEGCDLASLAAGTGLSEGEALDACAYWVECGLLLEEQTIPVLTTEAEPAPEPLPQATAKKAPELLEVKPQKPTFEQIRRRLSESAEIRELFNEAQVHLGRTIGTGDQATLLLLHDYYGLPADVILILCEYARSRGKTGNLNFIYSTGANWSSREIDTFDRASAELERLQTVDASWGELCRLTGMEAHKPTASQQKYMGSWLKDWGFSLPMVALAYEKMRERTDSVKFSYLNGILKNWREKGILTPEAAAEEERLFREKKAAKATAPAKKEAKSADRKSGLPEGPASYDLEKAERDALLHVPVHTKKTRRQG